MKQIIRRIMCFFLGHERKSFQYLKDHCAICGKVFP